MNLAIFGLGGQRPAVMPGGGGSAAAGGSGRAVLIIDDEQTLARNLAAYLHRLGYEVQTAGSAEEGLTRHAQFRPDVVLLDHNLPGMSGLHAIDHLRELDPQSRIVLVTGFGSTELAVDAIKRGATDYLAKPVMLSELKRLLDRLISQDRLCSTATYYHQRDAHDSGLKTLIGDAPAMVALRGRIARLTDGASGVGGDDAPIQIVGEPGSGTSRVARALHFGSRRAAMPFVEASLAATDTARLEAELFGRDGGTVGAVNQRHTGRVEAAEGGTLFLDDIDEAASAVQERLLALLADRRFRRVGGMRERRADVRLVVAARQPLAQAVAAGRLDAELHRRLGAIELRVPPLRERGGDVLLLARHFLDRLARRGKRPAPLLSAEAEAALLAHAWPGNVRELKRVVEQALLVAGAGEIGRHELVRVGVMADGTPASGDGHDLNLERMERRLIEAAWASSGGAIAGAARLLGVTEQALSARLRTNDPPAARDIPG